MFFVLFCGGVGGGGGGGGGWGGYMNHVRVYSENKGIEGYRKGSPGYIGVISCTCKVKTG